MLPKTPDNFRISDRLEWGLDATFVPNKRLPVYNWFYYKEGYSRDMVIKTLDMLGMRSALAGNGGFVLDPFCGVGTTNLACKELGINSVGFDVSPLALLAARVKCGDYDIVKLKDTLSLLRQVRFEAVNKSWIPNDVSRFFNPHTLDDIVLFGKYVSMIDDGAAREFFKLGLISMATRCSFMYKDGSVVKMRKHHVAPFRKVYFAHMEKMIHDVKQLNTQKCKSIIAEGDAKSIRLEDGSIDCVITSPPYLNKIEYTKIYGAEEFLFFGGRGHASHGIRSYIGLRSDDEPIFPGLSESANAYFSDMNRVMGELYRVCRQGAKLAIVVGNGCFPECVVESDALLARLAEKAGFTVNNIMVLNRRWCTKQRVIKVGELRESMVVLEKQF